MLKKSITAQCSNEQSCWKNPLLVVDSRAQSRKRSLLMASGMITDLFTKNNRPIKKSETICKRLLHPKSITNTFTQSEFPQFEYFNFPHPLPTNFVVNDPICDLGLHPNHLLLHSWSLSDQLPSLRSLKIHPGAQFWFLYLSKFIMWELGSSERNNKLFKKALNRLFSMVLRAMTCEKLSAPAVFFYNISWWCWL